jgi:hypothetical protein
MATAPKTIPAIKVLCSVEGFRRGGLAFGPEAKIIALADLTKEQLAAIEGEPRLITVRTTIDATAADGEGATKT